MARLRVGGRYLGWRVAMTKPGVGVIGLGVGERHAHAYAADPRCRLTAICDRDPAKLAEVGARFPGVRRYARAEELIDDPEISVVSVASNDDDHFAQIERSLNSRKHVFAEKPLCSTEDELARLVGSWRKSGVRLTTNTLLRRSPRFVWLKAAIDAGELGRVYAIEADYVYGRLHKLTDGWRGKIPGYSVMLGGGIHLVDLATWIVGDRPVEAFAYGSGLASKGTSFDGNDQAMALLRFESGLIARVGANFAAVHPHFHRFLVYGTRGTFENAPEAPGAPARLWASRDPGVTPQAVSAPYPGLDKSVMIGGFLDAVTGAGEPDISEQECFATVAVCLAIDRATRTGSPVRIAYPPIDALEKS
jgi:predicted dehydrogenase